MPLHRLQHRSSQPATICSITCTVQYVQALRAHECPERQQGLSRWITDNDVGVKLQSQKVIFSHKPGIFRSPLFQFVLGVGTRSPTKYQGNNLAPCPSRNQIPIVSLLLIDRPLGTAHAEWLRFVEVPKFIGFRLQRTPFRRLCPPRVH